MTPLRVQNLTRHTTVATRAERRASFMGRLQGLMGQGPLAPGEALILDPSAAIHTFFLRDPIDVLYLNREQEIVRAVEWMVPWRIGPLYTRDCAMILELPVGTIQETTSRVGDQLRIEPALA